ncbi:MAG: hypothetical protein WBE89_13555 [Methyloceanibacter sp.]
MLDLRPGFLAVPRGFDARPAFRTGFLAAVFLVALRALAVFALGFGDCFFAFELFFFGDAGAAFALRRVALGVRFFAAPIAAPESAPITVPTTGTPKAVPAIAPATAPPMVLLVLPGVAEPASAAPLSLSLSSLSLSSIFLSPR